jgi:hypothetical protein
MDLMTFACFPSFIISQVIRLGPGKVESIEPAEVEEKLNEMIVETLSSLVPPTGYISLKSE